MALFISTIVITGAAIVASIIHALVPRISINYVSMIIGVGIALIVPLNRLIAPFHSEVFMYIVAPLIYFEGQTTRINLIRQSVWKIVWTAVILVVIMMVVSGTILSLVGVPIALAFLIAALSTPTDATATEAVSEGLIVPPTQKSFLKMESLFNDASGIILASATALWVEQGNFDYQRTISGFLFSAIGGIIVGVIFALIMISFRRSLYRFNVLISNAQNILFIITPFVVYFIAEELHVSGIIAVVCAGLMQNSESASSRFVYPRQFHTGEVLINLLNELLNNFVFVILGVLIIRVIRDDIFNQDAGFNWIGIGIILYLINIIIRYLFGRGYKMGNRGSWIFSLGGVRGAITLALVFTVANNVTATQFRNIILIEALVVILCMVVPTIVFPFILKHDISEKETIQRMNSLKQAMVEEGLKAVQNIYLPDRVRESVCYDLRDQRSNNSLKDFWQQWFRFSKSPEFSAEERELEQRALRWAFKAEREYLDMVSQRENMREYVFQLYNGVLLAESILIDPDSKLS